MVGHLCCLDVETSSVRRHSQFLGSEITAEGVEMASGARVGTPGGGKIYA